MGRKTLLLFVLAAVLVAGSVFLFIYRQAGAADRIIMTYEEVLSRPSTRAVYHSINNWETEEDTEFTGVKLHELLESQGIEDAGAAIKILACDEYFWPAVGTVLTLEDLRQPNPDGLYDILAYEMNGAVLDPEPDLSLIHI
jgi:DMSO/TMAO reductase YedYZ molybdopterin-dependent catalytic subunit